MMNGIRNMSRNTLAGDGLPQELAEILNYTDADACKKSMETVKVKVFGKTGTL